MNKFISYEGLPINSGGAHSISKNSPKENYEQTLYFLSLFADTTEPKSIELTLYKSQNKDYSNFKLLLKLILKFGIPNIKNDGWLKTWNWKLTKKNITKALDTLKLNNELPKNPAGPITISFYWNFHFKNPNTNQILPNQNLIPELDFRNKNSQIYLRLSKKSTISVWFAFPFNEIGKYESEFIKGIKDNLPFKMSDKHWRIWKKSEKGNWIPRKIEIIGFKN